MNRSIDSIQSAQGRRWPSVLFAAFVAVNCFVASSHAGTISRSLITAPSDIVNTGLGLIDARNFGGTGTATVNGITHANNNGNYAPVNFSGGFGDPNGGVFSGDLFSLLDGIAGTTNANEPGTFSVGGLTPGQEYLFQTYWIVKDNFGSRKLNVTFEGDSLNNIDANGNTSEAVLISYNFTATDTTLDASVFADGGDNNTWLNGYSLQNAPSGPAPVTIADLRNDFVAGVNAGDQAANIDATGSGSWNYFSVDEENPGNMTLLEWDTNVGAGLNFENAADDSHTNGNAAGTGFNAWPIVGENPRFGGSLNGDELFVHPGDDPRVPTGDEFALLRWTAGADESGLINISGSVRKLNDVANGNADGIGLEILVDGVSVFSTLAVNSVDIPFDFDATIFAGQNVDFIINHGPGELHFDDSGALSVNIQLIEPIVPEPTTAVLALFGLAGLAARRRRAA